ncbi:MAG: helix-turn-helix domain-containing protein [Spirochaetaceae bacterium]|nr:helix-turn-helix domain-containing protein [Spirochaetaceae bacterium]MDT8296980.1 helix-turn-helix domain-containing protein [Spirochaetaceae bacterium]
MSSDETRERWLNLASDYEISTGISCRLLELDDTRNKSCPVCSDLAEQFGIDTACSQTHHFAAYQSERWGGRYVYLCPLSTLHWSSPLIQNGMMVGALIAGPVLLNGIDNATLSSIGDRYNLNTRQISELHRQYEKISSLKPQRVNSLSNLLHTAAQSGSDRQDAAYFEDQESFQHESRIGEYLHLLKSMEGDKNSDMDYPIDLERKLLSHVAKGEKSNAQGVLDQLIARVMYITGVNLDVIKSRILELVVLLSRAALEGGADVEQIFGLNYRYLQGIRRCSSTDELTSWLRRIINRFGDLVFDLRNVKHTETILRSLRFMRENFYERISLKDVAAQVGLSPDYFGKFFRQEIGRSFSEFLNGLRIEEAKRLLANSTASLGDIGYACGFEDQSYFTRVFRKSVGTTPSMYRERTQRYPGVE